MPYDDSRFDQPNRRNNMQVEWYGQSAFRLSTDEASVFIDPFSDMSGAASRGIEFNYPAIADVDADLLLITHEHFDHNGVEAIGGSPSILRSTAGRLESPVGEVLAVASEHDEVAGTERGPNTIFAFALDGLRVCHFGDFGQSHLRDEQASAIGSADLLFIPVGAGPTIGAEDAAEIAGRLSARYVVPMHYRTPRVNFLDPVDAFLELMPAVQRIDGPRFETGELKAAGGAVAVVPGAP
jgi:L-ascorbate metabolism protein UlaG (beta-lactamase superfamily)